MGDMTGWWGKLIKWMPAGDYDEPSLSTTKTSLGWWKTYWAWWPAWCLTRSSILISTLTSLLARNILAIIKLYLKHRSNCLLYFPTQLLYPIQCKLYSGRSAISVGHIVLELYKEISSSIGKKFDQKKVRLFRYSNFFPVELFSWPQFNNPTPSIYPFQKWHQVQRW